MLKKQARATAAPVVLNANAAATLAKQQLGGVEANGLDKLTCFSVYRVDGIAELAAQPLDEEALPSKLLLRAGDAPVAATFRQAAPFPFSANDPGTGLARPADTPKATGDAPASALSLPTHTAPGLLALSASQLQATHEAVERELRRLNADLIGMLQNNDALRGKVEGAAAELLRVTVASLPFAASSPAVQAALANVPQNILEAAAVVVEAAAKSGQHATAQPVATTTPSAEPVAAATAQPKKSSGFGLFRRKAAVANSGDATPQPTPTAAAAAPLPEAPVPAAPASAAQPAPSVPTATEARTPAAAAEPPPAAPTEQNTSQNGQQTQAEPVASPKRSLFGRRKPK